MDAHTAGRENHAHTLFPLMVFERWADANILRRGSKSQDLSSLRKRKGARFPVRP